MTTSVDDEILTLRDAADRLGCHYMTLYRRVRSGEIEALLVGGSYRVRAAELERWLARRPARRGAVPTRARTRPRDWARHAAVFGELVCAGDAEGALRHVERLAANGADPVEICERAIVPTMVAIGTAWQRGEASEAVEHRATAIVESVLSRIGAAFATTGPRRGVVVVATPEGERHSLPAQMVACALRADRWAVQFLGGDLPPAVIAAFARDEGATLAAVSCCRLAARPALGELVAALHGCGIPVIAGGAGLDEAAALALGADAYGTTLGGAQEAARRLSGAGA